MSGCEHHFRVMYTHGVSKVNVVLAIGHFGVAFFLCFKTESSSIYMEIYFSYKWLPVNLASSWLAPNQKSIKVTVDLQRPNFAKFFFCAPDIAKASI